MGKVIERGKKRRAKQAKKEKPVAQNYGGSKERSRELGRRNDRSIDYGEGSAYDGTKAAYGEREKFQGAVNAAHQNVSDERAEFWKATQGTLGQNESERLKQLGAEEAYGLGSDQSLADYRGGRGAVLGGASALEQAGGRSAGMLEGYATNAAAEYQSAADLAAKAAAERTQRAALGIAAGRGANSVRTALAGANAANAQASLDQQVVRAQEANQLNQMRNQAIADAAAIRASGIGGAAQIRQGVGAQDQAAAQIQAQRQQNAGAMAADALGMRAGLERGNADYQLQGAAQQQQLERDNLNAGMTAAGLESEVGSNMAGQFLGAEGNQYSSQLGADAATDAQRQQWAQNNSAHAKFKRGVGTATLGILGS